jgi:hypothetical protein
MAQFEITWEAPEFEYREKTVSWYWASIIIAACIIAFSVWERNFLFGLFIVIAEILIIMLGNQEPRMIAFSITEDGVQVGAHKFHSLKEFESWSAEDQGEGVTELAFNFRSKIKLPLKMFVPTDKIAAIRINLKPLLREVEHQTAFIEVIERWLGF